MQEEHNSIEIVNRQDRHLQTDKSINAQTLISTSQTQKENLPRTQGQGNEPYSQESQILQYSQLPDCLQSLLASLMQQNSNLKIRIMKLVEQLNVERLEKEQLEHQNERMNIHFSKAKTTIIQKEMIISYLEEKVDENCLINQKLEEKLFSQKNFIENFKLKCQNMKFYLNQIRQKLKVSLNIDSMSEQIRDIRKDITILHCEIEQWYPQQLQEFQSEKENSEGLSLYLHKIKQLKEKLFEIIEVQFGVKQNDLKLMNKDKQQLIRIQQSIQVLNKSFQEIFKAISDMRQIA